MALARMNADSVTPRDLADWASMSRSRTATSAVRWLDSERGRDGAARRACSFVTTACLPALAGFHGPHPMMRQALAI
jgi:hypothetical protein